MKPSKYISTNRKWRYPLTQQQSSIMEASDALWAEIIRVCGNTAELIIRHELLGLSLKAAVSNKEELVVLLDIIDDIGRAARCRTGSRVEISGCNHISWTTQL
ncbi:hypothetical protein HDU90_004439 [Geranomyces variabilis]|nr:hypothetical protein HDU90_004439 [Geranomyces variabilis]